MSRRANWTTFFILLGTVACLGWAALLSPRSVDAWTRPAAPRASIPSAVEAARASVVRIETEGSFRAPFMERDAEMGGSGSGFVIDANGTIVTNAHVVNGGSIFRVYFDGAAKPVDAALLGVAECSDLALLDLVDDDHPSLRWSDQTLARGMDVFAIGYPESVEQAVVTAGTVRAAAESGFEDWASVQTVIRHTAEVDPGNSGGPLLDEEGAVVGVVYAEGRDNPFGYAISEEDARATIGALQRGEDADSLGINGVAFAEGDEQWGVWVLSVTPNSPADASGIQRGDILRALDGRDVGKDGSMRAYCDVLRNRDAGEVLPIRYYRPSTGEVWEAEVNGAAAAVTGALDAAVYPTPTPFPTPTPSPLKIVSDEKGLLAVDVPEHWEYFESGVNGFGSIVYGPRLLVSSNARDFERGLDVPRVYLSAGQLRSPIDIHEYFDRIAAELPCIGYDRNWIDLNEWEGTVQTTIGCGVPEPTLYNAILYSKADDTIYLTVDVYLPPAEGSLRLDQLLAPTAASLLSGIPFWDVPQATVLVEGLNVRSGPGTEHERRDMVTRGEVLPVAGKDSDSCGWLYINFSNLKGWVSSDSQFVQLDRPCADLAILTTEMIAGSEQAK